MICYVCNNDQLMDDVMTKIYPKELSLTSDDAVLHTHYLDYLEIRDGKIHSKLFDKRDAFSFSIVNYPDLSGNIPAKQSYGVFASQLIRYGRCCMHVEDFISRTKRLISKLTSQGFKTRRLRQTFDKFASRNYELLFKYNHSTLLLVVANTSVVCCLMIFCRNEYFNGIRLTGRITVTGSVFAFCLHRLN